MKRFLIFMAAIALCLALASCRSEGAADTGEKVTQGTEATETIDPLEEEQRLWDEMDLTDVVESWRGQSDHGLVKTPGTWDSTVVKSLADLAPYRAFFPDLTDLEAARITSDEDGLAVVLEIASPNTKLIFGVDLIIREEGSILFEVSGAEELREEPLTDEYGNEIEAPDPGSPYEYFLFYLPAEEYHDETITFSFAS